ncbi:MAG: GIY-YIG nuclease family protein [Candidatus Poseidoniales archaeon]|nr:GIY-YIG nuclease family protein [Candidatus Poseidoniales archaeon]
MVNIYVLKLKSGKYYVGKTNHTFQRFNQHQTGSGAKWTKTYPVVDLFAFHHAMKDSDENKITVQMMKKYGVKNVRGGSWTKVNMTQNEINKLESKINKRRTVKRRKSKSCSRCGRSSHTISSCYARFHANGKSLERKEKVSADDYRKFLINYRDVRNSVAKEDPKLDEKDVDEEISELKTIQSESPDKLSQIMEAFSEEDDTPRFDVALDESFYSVIKMMGDAVVETITEAIDETEKQVKNAAKKVNKLGKRFVKGTKKKLGLK